MIRFTLRNSALRVLILTQVLGEAENDLSKSLQSVPPGVTPRRRLVFDKRLPHVLQ